MAGKKRMQSRSGARKAQFAKRAGVKKVNGKSVGGSITVKNKEARALKHELLVEQTAKRKAETTKLFEQVCKQYKLDTKGKYALKRLIGTINKSRLSSILDYTYRTENWFLERNLSDNAVKLINSTKLGSLL